MIGGGRLQFSIANLRKRFIYVRQAIVTTSRRTERPVIDKFPDNCQARMGKGFFGKIVVVGLHTQIYRQRIGNCPVIIHIGRMLFNCHFIFRDN